ncbi:MAG: hypothetical protein AB7I38_11835 [Dehalococcoidia bacterium]
MTEPQRERVRAPVAPVDRRSLIQQRVQWVFDTVVLPGRGPFKATEVARWINESGGEISAIYLQKILRGERTPSLAKLEWIGRFFGIPPTWWVSDNPPELDVPALVRALRLRESPYDPAQLQRKIAALSPGQQLAVQEIVDNLLRAEGKDVT